MAKGNWKHASVSKSFDTQKSGNLALWSSTCTEVLEMTTKSNVLYLIEIGVKH